MTNLDIIKTKELNNLEHSNSINQSEQYIKHQKKRLQYEFSNASRIEKIIQPLVEQYSINYFSYVKVFWDAKLFSLSNRADITQYQLQHELYQQECHDQPLPIGQKMILHSELDENTNFYQLKIKPICDRFNLTQSCTLIIYTTGATSFFTFSVPRSIQNFEKTFLKDIDVFEQFTTYFIEQSQDILKNGKRACSPLKITAEDIDRLKKAWFEYWCGSKSKLYKSFIPRKHFFHDDAFQDIYLTKRESECLKLIFKGHSYNQIADILKLSARTIHKHVETLLLKMRCKSKKELIAMGKTLNVFSHDICIASNADMFNEYLKFIAENEIVK